MFNLLYEDNKVWKRKTVLIVLISAFAFSAYGQSLPDDSVLESLVRKALTQNPDLLAVSEQTKSAEYKISPAGSLPDPMAMVGLSGPLADSWVGEPMATPSLKLGISQKFPFPGKLGAMKKAAENRALGSNESFESARQSLAATVRSAYYDLAYWLTAMKTVNENIELVDELEAVARQRYKVGLGLQVNVLQAQKTLTRLEDRKLAIGQMIETSNWRLARLVGDIDSGRFSASLPSLEKLPVLDNDLLKEKIAAENPLFKKTDHDIRMRQKLLQKAKLDYLPDFTMGVAYGFRWENEMFPMFGTDMLSVTAGFNIPLWAGWKQKNLVSSARANLRMSEFKKSDIHDRLIFELEKNLLEYERNNSKYALYEQSLVPQTQATLESARAAYQVGKLEFLDVITAQMDLFNAELETQRSLADALKALAEIDKLTADAVPSVN